MLSLSLSLSPSPSPSLLSLLPWEAAVRPRRPARRSGLTAPGCGGWLSSWYSHSRTACQTAVFFVFILTAVHFYFYHFGAASVQFTAEDHFRVEGYT